MDVPMDKLEMVWGLWIAGMKKYYLHDNNTHFLYGMFENSILKAMVGWRCELPEPYNEDWIIVYLKADPRKNATKLYMVPLWKFMFIECEKRGFKKWHSLIKPERWAPFDAFYKRLIPEINNSYTYETTLVIPALTKPDVDWVWGMMGRRPLPDDYIIRTGTKIQNV